MRKGGPTFLHPFLRLISTCHKNRREGISHLLQRPASTLELQLRPYRFHSFTASLYLIVGTDILSPPPLTLRNPCDSTSTMSRRRWTAICGPRCSKASRCSSERLGKLELLVQSHPTLPVRAVGPLQFLLPLSLLPTLSLLLLLLLLQPQLWSYRPVGTRYFLVRAP